MSRLDGRPVSVRRDAAGAPVAVTALAGRQGTAIEVLAVVQHWREWIGALDGEPERDVWQVYTPEGVMELHCLHPPVEEDDCAADGDWLLYRWED